MERITKKTLRLTVALLNREMGLPTSAWLTPTGSGCRANVGVFVLDCAYGGYRLGRIVTEGGGQSDISPRGTARETHDYIMAMIKGIRLARNEDHEYFRMIEREEGAA